MQDEISLLELWAETLRQRWRIVGWSVGCAFVLVLWATISAATYTVTASFVPQEADQGGGAGRAAGLAAQLGFSVGGGSPGQSPQFYASLIKSDAILRPLVLTRFPYTEEEEEHVGTLVEILKPSGSAGERVTKAVLAAREALTVVVNDETGIVDLEVKTNDAALSKDVADSLLALVNAFNIHQRQTQSRAERVFAEGRAAVAAESLRVAEDQLQAFLSRNREFRNSPALTFEAERLQRVVALRQQVLGSLLVGLEQSRLDEVRNTPVITVLQSPVVPAVRDPRGRGIRLVLGLLLGASVGVGLAVWKRLIALQRHLRPEQLAEVEGLVAEVRGEIRSLASRILRFRRRSQS